MYENDSLTFNTDFQVFLHKLFGAGELTELNFGCCIILTHCADHLLLFLLVHLSVYINPGNFSKKKKKK